MPRSRQNHILHDIGIMGASILFAVWLQGSGRAEALVGLAQGIHWLESFIAGMFFTSAFTTAPSIVMLGNIAQQESALFTALFGGLGAVVGDMIIFSFFRDAIAEDVFELMGRGEARRLVRIFRLRMFRFITPFIGAFIMASPLPDEMALMLMGFSKTRTNLVVLFSFCANTFGILIIALAAQALGR